MGGAVKPSVIKGIESYFRQLIDIAEKFVVAGSPIPAWTVEKKLQMDLTAELCKIGFKLYDQEKALARAGLRECPEGIKLLENLLLACSSAETRGKRNIQ